MKALRVDGPGEAAVVSLAKPEMESDASAALVRIERMGLCGTDLKTYRGQNPLASYPRIIGHELYGTVVEVGADASIGVGTHVSVYPYSRCGTCDACRKGRPNSCKYNRTLGVQREGGGARFVSLPASSLVPVDGLDADSGVLVEPLSVSYHAVQRAHPIEGETVAVIGCGMIGLGAIMASAATGAEVIGIDLDPRKTDLARTVGATEVIDLSRTTLERGLRELTDDGPDVVIEAVGSASTFRAAVDHVGYAGRVVYIGYTNERVEYDPKQFVAKELDVFGSRNATHDDFRAVISLLRAGSVDVSPLISHRRAIDEGPAALRFWSDHPSEVTKIVLSLA